MEKEFLLNELQSDKKYLSWNEVEKLAKRHNLTISYQNKYVSWLIIRKGIAICIHCKNVYGSQMIESFS